MKKIRQFLQNNIHYISIFFSLFFIAFFIYFPITNTDIWWHLAGAREMIANKHILRYDPFSFTLQEPDWINISWFFQIIVFFVYKLFGICGILYTKILFVTVASLLILLAVPRKKYSIITSVFLMFFIYQSRYLILARPIFITLLGISVYLFCLERFSLYHKKKYLLFLIPIQILWVNSQGLFALGPIILFTYLLGYIVKDFRHKKEKLKLVSDKSIFILAVLFLILVIVGFLNPYGIDGFLYPIKLFFRINPSSLNIYSRNVSENVPIFSLYGNNIVLVFTVLFATMITMLTFFINRRRINFSHLFLFLSFLLLAIMAKRNVLLFLFITPLIIGTNINTILMSDRNIFLRLPKSLYTIIFVVLLLLLTHHIVIHSVIISKYPYNSCISPFRVPISSVKYLKKNPVEGQIFNSIRYGGYLIWKNYPERKVFIDGRMVIRPIEYLKEYFYICNNPDLFPIIANKFNITHSVFPVSKFVMYNKLIRWFYNSNDWKLVLLDGESILFINKNQYNNPGINLNTNSGIKKVFGFIDERWPNDSSLRIEALKNVYSFARDLNAIDGLNFIDEEIKKNREIMH